MAPTKVLLYDSCTSTPQLPLEIAQRACNRVYKAPNRGMLGGLSNSLYEAQNIPTIAQCMPYMALYPPFKEPGVHCKREPFPQAFGGWLREGRRLCSVGLRPRGSCAPAPKRGTAGNSRLST